MPSKFVEIVPPSLRQGNCIPSQWGGQLFAAVRSIVDTGRQNGLSVFQAIRATLDGNSIFMPV